MAWAALWRRVEQLEQRASALPLVPVLDPQVEARLCRTEQRLFRLIDAALPLLTEEEDVQVAQALEDWLGHRSGAFSAWFRDLGWERSCVPELTPAATRALLLAWLSPQRDTFQRVCRRCGLEYPSQRLPPWSEWKVLLGKVPQQGEPPWYDLPEFFESCPGCGGSRYDFDWAHLVGDDAPWKADWQ